MQHGAGQRPRHLSVFFVVLAIGASTILSQSMGRYDLWYFVDVPSPSVTMAVAGVSNVTASANESSFKLTPTNPLEQQGYPEVTPMNMSFMPEATTTRNESQSISSPTVEPPLQADAKTRRRRRRQKPNAPKKSLEQPSWSPILKTPYLNATRLLQSGYFRQVAESIARAYPDKSSSVCSLERPVVNKFNSERVFTLPIEGVFYNKMPKAASSTLAGINRRIAVHWGHRLHGTGSSSSNKSLSYVLDPKVMDARANSCTHKEFHVIGAGRFYGNRVQTNSFLWGSIRDPASRALSRVFFYQISQGGLKDDDETILLTLTGSYNRQTGCISKGRGGFQLQYLALNTLDEWLAWGRMFPTTVQRPDIIEEQVRNVTQQYDFLALTERMDESIVALQLLLGLNVGDVLSTSAKVGGAFYYHGKDLGCIPLRKTHSSPAVGEYLESDEWQAVNYGDYLLYAAANRSLDMTIDRLGRDRFDNALQIYRSLLAIVEEECARETYFPCSEDGKAQVDLAQSSCYEADEGCGYACIDRLVHERGW